MTFDEPMLLLGAMLKVLMGLRGRLLGWGETELLLLVTGSNILCLLCILLSLT